MLGAEVNIAALLHASVRESLFAGDRCTSPHSTERAAEKLTLGCSDWLKAY
jgi:hypothetical protein